MVPSMSEHVPVANSVQVQKGILPDPKPNHPSRTADSSRHHHTYPVLLGCEGRVTTSSYGPEKATERNSTKRCSCRLLHRRYQVLLGCCMGAGLSQPMLSVNGCQGPVGAAEKWAMFSEARLGRAPEPGKMWKRTKTVPLVLLRPSTI